MFLSISTFVFVSTIVLILFKKSWGYIPTIVVKLLEDVLSSLVGWRQGEEYCYKNGVKKFLTVDYVKEATYTHPFEASTDLLCLGMQSILQDDLTQPFVINRDEASLLEFPREKANVPFYLFGLVFRWGVLLPFRICLMTATLVFLTVSALTCVIVNAKQKSFRYCGITFAKLFNASTGLIVNFHGEENRPKMPGVAVANHLSANDVMTIYSGCDYDGKGYTITGQLHGGFVKYLVKYGGKLTPVIFFNRAVDGDRRGLLQTIVEHSERKDEQAYPILLFPEGYCSNNRAVLQFRKGIFDGHVPIYPICLQQNPRFGDAFWVENTYLPYLIRLMTSWCSIVDIHYLPPMYKTKDESEEQFAKRVQTAIAAKLSVDALPYDGKLKSAKEQLKYKSKLQTCFANKQWGGGPEQETD